MYRLLFGLCGPWASRSKVPPSTNQNRYPKLKMIEEKTWCSELIVQTLKKKRFYDSDLWIHHKECLFHLYSTHNGVCTLSKCCHRCLCLLRQQQQHLNSNVVCGIGSPIPSWNISLFSMKIMLNQVHFGSGRERNTEFAWCVLRQLNYPSMSVFHVEGREYFWFRHFATPFPKNIFSCLLSWKKNYGGFQKRNRPL